MPRPPQLASSTLHTQKPRSLPRSTLLLGDNTHSSSSSSVLHTHPKPLIRLPVIPQAVLARPGGRGCTFLFVVGKCGPPQTSGWVVPMCCFCHHEDFIGALSSYGEHALAYAEPQFSGHEWSQWAADGQQWDEA